mmetsp:Transcript_5394/g.9661  ORF Transcript_5394/g.9661 Transcript_5394/m.9661 type:complete len:291 (+) Transcript_5394:756-1628(+)
MHPSESTLLMLVVVPLLKHLHALRHLRREGHLWRFIRRPVASSENLHAKRKLGIQLLHPLVEFALLLAPHGQIVQHTLHLRRELRPALHLQLGNHRLLGIVARGALVQETLCQLIPVNFRKQILVIEEGEELHDPIKVLLHLRFAELLPPALQYPIAKGGHELGVGKLADVVVDNFLKGVFEGLLEEVVAGKGFANDAEILFVEVNEALHKLRIVVLVFLPAVQPGLPLLDACIPLRCDELLDNIGHRLKARLQTRKQLKHSLQVIRLIIRKQDAAPTPLLLQQIHLHLL